MAQFSFDVVSDYDKAEMNNVFDQVTREMGSRFQPETIRQHENCLA